MIRKLWFLTLVILMCSIGTAQSPIPPALYFEAEDLAMSVEATLAERGNMGVGRVRTSDDYRINLIHRTKAATAIVHEVGTELHYITAGSGTLVTGGVVVRPDPNGPAYIDGGLARKVTIGDAILIPRGTPHWYSSVDGSVTYLEVRFNTDEYP